ncbi:MAG: response regulator [Vicinamibacterales bacterium]
MVALEVIGRAAVEPILSALVHAPISEPPRATLGFRRKVTRLPATGRAVACNLPAESSNAAARAIAPDPADQPAPAPKRGQETILVVDDEPAVRNLLDSVLSRSGYTVLKAGDGPEAQALAATHAVALLCTDVVMPGGGGGIDLYRELSAAHPGLRVLYMSGYPERLLADRAALTPANFIRKPFMPADIVRRIRQILDR